MNNGMYHELVNVLYHEAYLLDHRKYKEWLELLDDELVYRMPLRVTTEKREASDFVDDMTFFEETKKSLTTRVNRLYTNSAWIEDPPARQRHFVSNIVVNAAERPDEVHVRSYFLFKRSRGSDIHTEELFGEREDLLRKTNGHWKLVKRTIYPDQAVINVMNLGMFL